MSKHTQETWEAKFNPEMEEIWYPNGYWEVGPATIGVFDPDAGKYAHLIAAAPDLLEACRYALEYTIANGDAHDRLRAAIAKAEGGAK